MRLVLAFGFWIIFIFPGLSQDSLETNTTYYSVTDGWKVGFVPTALISFKPTILTTVAYGWGNQFEFNTDLGASSWLVNDRTTQKYIVKPTLKFFPGKNIFFVGTGFILDVFNRKEEADFLRDGGNYTQKLKYTYQELFTAVPVYMGIQDELYKDFFLEFSFGFNFGRMDVRNYNIPEDAFLVQESCFFCINRNKSVGNREYVKGFINLKFYFKI